MGLYHTVNSDKSDFSGVAGNKSNWSGFKLSQEVKKRRK